MSGNEYRPGKMAFALDPDCLPWERQPGESEQAYAAFVEYRDMPGQRKVGAVTESANSALRWSAKWSWQYRVLEWDRYISRESAAEMVRYRVEMSSRQRAAARLAQARIVKWLQDLDPTRLRPMEAARWFEVAVKVERLAAGTGEQDAGSPFDLEFPQEGTAEFDRMMDSAGIDKREFANVLSGLMRDGA